MTDIDPKGLYRALGVRPGASVDEVKHAFRHLAKTTHPDVAKTRDGANTRFQDILAAYRTLSDPQTKAAYDAAFADKIAAGTALTAAAAGAFHGAAQTTASATRQVFDLARLRRAANAYAAVAVPRPRPGGALDLAA